MNYSGIGIGLYKTLEGLMEGDVVKMGKGLVQTTGSFFGSFLLGGGNNENVAEC